MNFNKAIKSVSLLWLGSFIGSGSTFVIYTILAREIGPEAFGLFSAALATITIFTLLAGFGISKVWLKLFGEEGWNGIRWIKPSLIFVALTIVFISFAIFLFAMSNVHDEVTKQLLLLLIFFVYGYLSVELVSSKYQLEEKFGKLAFWQMLPNLLRLILIFFFIYILKISLSVIEIGLIYAVVGALFTVFAIIQLYKMSSGNLELKGHINIQDKVLSIPKVKDVMVEAWPFGMASLFAFIYVQSDIIMVKYISGNQEAGYYNVAFVILTAILIIPTILFGKFLLPKYHRWANHDKAKFHDAYKKGSYLMIISGVLIMGVLLLTSSTVIPIFFGDDYQQSVALMKILSFTLPISFLSYSVGATLVTKEHMKLKVKLMGAVAILNIILNIFLIPKFGSKGAAFATLISNILLLYLYYNTAKYKIFN